MRNDKNGYLMSTYMDHGYKIKTNVRDLRAQNIYGFLLRISLFTSRVSAADAQLLHDRGT